MDDLISRQAAIDVAKHAWAKGLEPSQYIEELPSTQPDHIVEVSKKVDADLISRADVEQTVEDNILCYTHSDRPIDQDPDTECHKAIRIALRMLRKDLRKLPPAQPEQDILSWLLAYHTKSFDLHGRYMPHEVIGWLVHDFANAYMAERREE